jgi:hypothetical protein
MKWIPEAKRPGSEAADVKNKYYASTPPYVFVVSRLLQQGITFFIYGKFPEAEIATCSNCFFICEVGK